MFLFFYDELCHRCNPLSSCLKYAISSKEYHLLEDIRLLYSHVFIDKPFRGLYVFWYTHFKSHVDAIILDAINLSIVDKYLMLSIYLLLVIFIINYSTFSFHISFILYYYLVHSIYRVINSRIGHQLGSRKL